MTLMGMLSEFFRYFFAVVAGRRDPLAAFIEPLTLAERYLHWGREGGDLRDFLAGLEQLRMCQDNDAPLPTLVIRKYACLMDIVQSGVDALLDRHERKLREAESREADARYERDSLKLAIQETTALRDRLKADGSLLKAREQDRMLNEHETRMKTLQEVLAELEERGDLCDSYDITVSECDRFLQYLDQSQLTISLGAKIPADTRGILARQIRDRLESLRQRMSQVDPIRRPAMDGN